MSPVVDPTGLRARIERDVQRSVWRARNGIRYATGSTRPDVGRSAKDTVWRRDKAQLWRYRGSSATQGPPLLLVPSLVGRSYILDLRPGNSLIEFLVAAGFDVSMLDWGVPDERDAENTLETYVDEYLPRAVQALLDVSGTSELTLIGYCLGGVLTLLYAASQRSPPIRGLVAMATPIDWSAMGPLVALLREGRLDTDNIVDHTGNVPPEAIFNSFRMLSPTGKLTHYASLWENLWNDEYVTAYQAMTRWTGDHVPFPGALCRQLIDLLIRENALAEGSLTLSGQPVELSAIRCPVLNVIAEYDKIVPPHAAAPLAELVGSKDRETLLLRTGHAGFAAGRQATKVTLPKIVDWLVTHGTASETSAQ